MKLKSGFLNKVLLLGSIVVLLVALATPGQAAQVQILPANPHLGDTLSVLIQQDSNANGQPSVTLNQKTYPAFEIAPHRFRAMIPTTPLEQPGVRRIQVNMGEQVRNLAVQVRNRSFPIQRINLPPGKAGISATQYELDRVAEFKKLVTPQKYWNGPFARPNKGRISAIYGVRRYYNGKFAKDYYHRGVDYAGGVGSPVVAPASGRVALVGTVSQGFRIHGNIIGIDHGQGVTSAFLHLSRIDVKEGDMVKPGQVIGAVGATGAVTGPHLHWGLYVHGESVDPVPWREQGFN
ncbi:M23 family metallopeptidase [Chroococcidiopsis sp. TS-821]|uniref:M23 family metallopeptidase n=1 Tax=Chroococcidiopsis sp. TS-821 TaxID=1378066 RepID=UPI000CEE30B9|nr:M23 family metallopeptidase [Chroococcidiopsis sp. TS-821]PPS45174.1 peptidase [Chroococcidiopsis sp. TS-821]